mmetsp:Transcript_36056/g.52845  ORF Transcript_36056/g.52845 Transcript_36056/m.52845 type:complete len:374 (-) Transcript_36056:42-1163(-)|eukprot:CAMPEP_0195522352 /NCGR_PEP_ID=MMETSP0794_2-20130614/20439_1 /TAXON_ID=515487 /ORGANISM="Stephanopyxis turris, Strain CCMP 815" /LENGTH=373 /DNA_ID=CAMNT_0040652091 /DNA_START=26 /DNA_END=1147 /DNA_ORIENTATION=+
MNSSAFFSIIVTLCGFSNYTYGQSNIRGSTENFPVKNETHILLKKNSESCTGNSMCASGCCSYAIGGFLTCENYSFFRYCVDDYHFVSGNEGQCNSGSDIGSLQITAYNIFQIITAPGVRNPKRANKITNWFAAEEIASNDIVVLSGNWFWSSVVKEGMVNAGYCHFAFDGRGMLGSGLAFYSKYPIIQHDFRSFGSDCAGEDCLEGKGVIYANINKDGKPLHIFGTHTNTHIENHDVRRQQYGTIRGFINEKVKLATDLVLIAGDLNEDKLISGPFYQNMLDDLNAGDFNLVGEKTSSYNSENFLVTNMDAKQALDFVLYDRTDGRIMPDSESTCEYLRPLDVSGNDLSDHYPISCIISFRRKGLKRVNVAT